MSPQKILFFWYILNKIALFGYFGVNIPTEVLCQCCQSSCVNNMDVNSTQQLERLLFLLAFLIHTL